MNQTVKKQWIEALRSGKYIQGRGALQTAENKFCCLGVLCDLYAKKFGGSWSKVVKGNKMFIDNRDDSAGGMPPRSVMNWAVLSDNQATILAQTNDRANSSFQSIATMIEGY